MAQISTNETKPGMKIELDGNPYLVISNQFVKPGKGQAFNKIKLKNILNKKVLEKTYKSGDKLIDYRYLFHKDLRIWDANNGILIDSFYYDKQFNNIDINNNDGNLLVNNSGGYIMIINPETGEIIRSVYHRLINNVKFSADGSLILASEDTGRVCVIDYNTFEYKFCFDIPLEGQEEIY